jgi:hypothetical protein
MSYAAIMLGLCQFLFMSSVAVGLAFNAIVGKMLAPSPGMATLPLFFMMGSTAVLTLAMPGILAKYGYRKVFITGEILGAASGSLAVAANLMHSFSLFCLAGLLTGCYQASAMYYRFAAADAVATEYKSSAIAWVLNGGILAAFAGPLIGSHSLHFFRSIMWVLISLPYYLYFWLYRCCCALRLFLAMQMYPYQRSGLNPLILKRGVQCYFAPAAMP